MALENHEIENLFKLSKLEYDADIVQEFGEKLAQVLGYVDLLSEVNVDGVEPLMHPSELTLTMRTDVVDATAVGRKGIENSPAYVDGFIRVPKIVE